MLTGEREKWRRDGDDPSPLSLFTVVPSVAPLYLLLYHSHPPLPPDASFQHAAALPLLREMQLFLMSYTLSS